MVLRRLRVKVADLSKEERVRVFREHMGMEGFSLFSREAVEGEPVYVFCYKEFNRSITKKRS